MIVGKLVWQEEVRKEDISCSDDSGRILSLRALQDTLEGNYAHSIFILLSWRTRFEQKTHI